LRTVSSLMTLLLGLARIAVGLGSFISHSSLAALWT
jgi:hypothetical protein